MKIYSIPEKLEVVWNAEAKAIIDTWSTYSVTLEEFKEAVLVKGLDFAKANGAIAWIVDSSAATGAFNADIQNFIGNEVFPSFAKNGIKYFATITSESSAITRMSIKSYSAKTGPNGLELLELPSAEDAIEWLKANK